MPSENEVAALAAYGGRFRLEAEKLERRRRLLVATLLTFLIGGWYLAARCQWPAGFYIAMIGLLALPATELVRVKVRYLDETADLYRRRVPRRGRRQAVDERLWTGR